VGPSPGAWGTHRGTRRNSARRHQRETLGTERREDEARRRAFRPRCQPLRNHPSANGRVAQLGTRSLGLPERPGEIDLNPLAIRELELDVAPAGHEVAIPVGLRDRDAVAITGTSWTAVVPPDCVHGGKLQVGPHGCHDALERGLRVSRSCRLAALFPAFGVTPRGVRPDQPVLSEMSGTTLEAMTQRVPHLGVSSANSESLLSHQMSRRLKVRRKFYALGKVCMRLLVGHGPGVATLRAASHLRATVPTPPTNTRHVENVPRFR
jgi:hypothetical protein